VAGVPRVTLFKPAGVPGRELEQLQLGVDELEAIRLVDLEGLSHEQAAAAMGVSRQTVGRVLERGRARVAEALVGGKAILIEGGRYRVAPRPMRCSACQARWVDSDEEPDTACPVCGSPDIAECWGRGDHCGEGRGRGRGAGRGRSAGTMGAGDGSGTGRGHHGGGRDTWTKDHHHERSKHE
jgi:predicted DNA-binding protein (UPF0251 family)